MICKRSFQNDKREESNTLSRRVKLQVTFCIGKRDEDENRLLADEDETTRKDPREVVPCEHGKPIKRRRPRRHRTLTSVRSLVRRSVLSLDVFTFKSLGGGGGGGDGGRDSKSKSTPWGRRRAESSARSRRDYSRPTTGPGGKNRTRTTTCL